MKSFKSLLTEEALGLTLSLEGGKGLEARVRGILDATRRRELLSRRALLGIGVGTALSVGVVALVGPKRSLPGKGEPIPARPTAQAWPREVTGRVLLPDGTPAVGATLWFTTSSTHGDGLDRLGETGPDGRYRFPVPRQGERFSVLALKENYGLAGTNHADATLTLSTPTTLRVRAVDETGTPLPNISLAIKSLTQGEFGERNYWMATELLDLLLAQTDDQGVALFTGLPEHANLRFKPNDLRYCPQEGNMGYGRSPKSLLTVDLHEAVLYRAVRVAGRVLDLNGQPRAGIVVAAQGIGLQNGWARSLTDAAGHYELVQLPPGRYNLALDLPESATVTARAHEGVTLKATQDQTGVDFHLESGCQIVGRVLGADDHPIVGYAVGVYGPAHPKSSAWVQRTVTDAKGRYQLCVPAGDQYLYLQGGDPPAGYGMPKDEARTLTVRTGQTRTEDFILPRVPIIPPITVTVLDGEGQPVQGAILRVEGKDPEDSYRFRGIETDTRGQGTISVRKQARYTVYAEHEGLYTPQVTTTPGQVHTLRLTERAGALAGQVLRADGTPLVGARIQLFQCLSDQGTSRGIQVGVTDNNGRFRFANLMPGSRFWVAVEERKPRQRGMIAPSHQSEQKVIPSGGTAELKPLHIVPPLGGG